MPLLVITLAMLCAATVGGLRHVGQAQTQTVQLYAGKCAPCHGTTGAGDGAVAQALDPKPPDFTTADYQKSNTDERIAASIRDGRGTMPGFKRQLSDTQIRDLVAYIRSFGPR